MIILVDIDSVLANWGKRYDELLDHYPEQSVGIPRATTQPIFNLYQDRLSHEVDVINYAMDYPGFYRDLEVYPGAKEALEEMRDLGNDVFIVSTPHISNPTCASDKYAWVEDNFGAFWAKRTVLTYDKTLVRGDILIDDKPNIIGAMEPIWKQILFTQNWNKDSDLPRINSWDMDNYLERIYDLQCEKV